MDLKFSTIHSICCIELLNLENYYFYFIFSPQLYQHFILLNLIQIADEITQSRASCRERAKLVSSKCATSKRSRLQPRNSQQIAYLFFNAEVIKLRRESGVDKSTVLK